MPWLPTRSMSPCRTSTVARASSSARWVGVVDAPNSRASADSFTLGASSLVRTRRASFTVHSTGGRGHPIWARWAAARRNPMSNPALWATSTAPLQNSRNEGRTASMRGASRTIAVVIPVSSTICGGMARPGSTRVASSPSTSPPRTLTAPISVMASYPSPGVLAVARPPVVSRSTTTKVVSASETDSNAASRFKASCSASAVLRWPMAVTVSAAPDKLRRARAAGSGLSGPSLQSAPLLVGPFAPIRSATCRHPAIPCAQHRSRGRSR